MTAKELREKADKVNQTELPKKLSLVLVRAQRAASQGQTCIYLYDYEVPTEVEHALREKGFGIAPYHERGLWGREKMVCVTW